jgi:hypothetical protein
MSIQRLHAFEKTDVQFRHTIKRLEVFVDLTKDDAERIVAEQLLTGLKEMKKLIPEEYRDADLKKSENK